VDGDRTFVIADLPGLIPGASEGRGLGHQFLRHTERTRLLLHLLDLDPASGRDPLDDLRVIDAELAAYSPSLAARPQLVVASKADLADGGPDAAAALARIRAHCAGAGRPFHAISAATGRGLGELLRDIAARLDDLGWARAAS
jgi:GTP-binding protein